MSKGNSIFGKIGAFFKKFISMWSKPPQGRYLTIKEIAYFGGATLGINFCLSALSYVITYSALPYAYKIPQIHGSIIVCIGFFINILIQPIIGKLMDTKTTKFGRYKPFILFILPACAIFGILATWIPQIDVRSRIIFAYLTTIPTQVLMNILNNMQYTMPNVMTPNTQERTDMMTPIGLIIGFAPTILSLVAGPIRSHFILQNREYMAFRLIGLISCALSIMLVFFILKVKERVFEVEDKKVQENIGIGKAVGLVSKNIPLMIFSLALCFGGLRDIGTMYFTYVIQFRYFESVTQALNWSGLFLTIIGFSSTVGMLLMPILTRKLSKKAVLILWTMLSGVAYGAFAIIGFGKIPVGKITMLVATPLRFLATMNATGLIIPLMMGDLCDYQQWKTGKRLEGYVQLFCFSLPGLIGQVSIIVAIQIMTKAIGFEIGDYSNLEFLSGEQQALFIKWMNTVSAVSAISATIMSLLLAFYPLTKKKCELIVDELKARNLNGLIEENTENAIEEVAK